MERDEIQTFLDKNKCLIGWGNWTVLLGKGWCGRDDCLAEIDVDRYRRVAVIHVTKNFFKLNEEQQRFTLVHEFLHGRYSQFKGEMDETGQELEEQYIIDLECFVAGYK